MVQILSLQHPGILTDDRHTTYKNEAQKCQNEAENCFEAGDIHPKEKEFKSNSPKFPFRKRLIKHRQIGCIIFTVRFCF